MAAPSYTSIGSVAATAYQFDLTSSPQKIPTAAIPDGDYARLNAGNGEGYKVKTTSGWTRPVSTDWIVTVSGKVFIVDNTTFAALFTV